MEATLQISAQGEGSAVGTPVLKPTRNPLRVARAIWRTLKDPTNTPEVLILEDVFMRSRWLQRFAGWRYVANHLRAEHPELRLDTLARLGHVDPSVLLAGCPDGSLGKVLGQHMKAMQLNPALFDLATVTNEEDAIRIHLVEAHDVWHVMTGFGTDINGEIGVVAFSAAQTRAPISTLLLAVALFNTALYEHSKLAERIESLINGWQAGKRARPLFGVDWSVCWQQDIEEARKAFNLDVQPGPGIDPSLLRS